VATLILDQPELPTYFRNVREKGMKSSVIVPVYNEPATVESIVRRIAAVPTKKEIIVADDGSTDGTREIVMDLKKTDHTLPLCCLFHQRNQGKGAAIRTALESITGEVVAIQDVDLEYHPEDFPTAFRPIRAGLSRCRFWFPLPGVSSRVSILVLPGQ
jgi:glycosyltransferase involved in cell wall biosynthesis